MTTMPPAEAAGASAEVLARAKLACPSCGADANWNPAKQCLVCPYCGTTAPVTVDAATGEVVEHDLVRALRGVPDESRGWATEMRQVKCQSCQAITVFNPNRVAQNCEFCGSAQIVPYEENKQAFRPESLLPFKVAETDARDRIRKWYGEVWFAPNALKTKALTDTVKGVYLPYWTFDAQAQAQWSAEAGYYYYENESYTDNEGRTQTRQVRRVRWVPASGNLSHFFDDDLVPASHGVHPSLLRSVEPFPTNELQPYQPTYVAGWVVERYQIDLVGAAQQSRQQMDNALRSMCAAQVPGDTHRNLQVDARYSAQTFKHILTPIWMLSYRYGSKAYQVVINGYTGQIAGEYPKSFWKIFFLVLGILIVVLAIVSLSRQ